MTAPLPDGADTFVPVVNRRAGYQQDKLAWVIAWIRKHPDATLASGEAALLVAEIDRLRGTSPQEPL